MKTLKEKIKLVESAFAQLKFLDNINWTSYRENLYQLALDGEKNHRKFMSGFNRFHPQAASASACAKMVSVRWIAGYMVRSERPLKIKNVISTRPDVVLAASLVANYRKEIRKALKGFDMAELAALDYCEFVGQAVAA